MRLTFYMHPDLNLFEVIIAALFYQVTLYVALRLAHGGFTLGELGLVCLGGTALCLEFLNITIARVRHLVSRKCGKTADASSDRFGPSQHHISEHIACLPPF